MSPAAESSSPTSAAEGSPAAPSNATDPSPKHHFRNAHLTSQLRETTYTAIGKLAARAPHVCTQDLSTVKLLFERLVMEDPTVRLSITEALGTLNTKFMELDQTSAGASDRGDLLELLEHYASSSEAQARQQALKWASTVFPATSM